MPTITLLPGDGIGPEVTAEAVKCLQLLSDHFDLAIEFQEQPFGGAAIDAVGHPLPEETLAACRSADAIFLGVVGVP